MSENVYCNLQTAKQASEEEENGGNLPAIIINGNGQNENIPKQGISYRKHIIALYTLAALGLLFGGAAIGLRLSGQIKHAVKDDTANIDTGQIDTAKGIQSCNTPSSETAEPGTWANPAKSCNELKQMEDTANNTFENGIYVLKLHGISLPVEVYCDMDVNGGGWTLVARIHENNIKRKCTQGDMWSSESGYSNIAIGESSNWENMNYFGFVYTPSSSDYKSPTYFALKARDVMVWHVPNDVPLQDISDRAILKYYTTTHPLNQYGGSLQMMYSRYFPLTRNDTDLMKNVFWRLRRDSFAVREQVPSYYSYKYDGINSYIGDGGGDMFDGGNKIYYEIGGSGFIQIASYDKLYTLSNGVRIGTMKSQPFYALMWIGNEDRSVGNFSLKVESGTGTDGSGSYKFYNGSISEGSLIGYYHVYNVYGAPDPSICKVFFYIADSSDYRMVKPVTFTKEDWTNADDPVKATVRISGGPRHVMMGYTLLSKTEGSLVTEDEVVNSLTKIFKDCDATIAREKGNVVENSFRELESYSFWIRAQIPSYYSYKYDGRYGNIQDGGNDMFDNGNRIYYKIGENNFSRLTTYNKVYALSNGVKIGTLTSHPFYALMWIGNEDRNVQDFSLRVYSGTGTDGSGLYKFYNGSISEGSLIGYYHVYNVYGTSDPSICKVFFYIYNSTDIRVVKPSSFSKVNWTNSDDPINATVRISGSPRNVMMGYTLFSRSSGNLVTEPQVTNSLRQMFKILSFGYKGVAVPIQFAKGSSNLVKSMVKLSLRQDIKSGYLRFYAEDRYGSPYAMCPGVDANSTTAAELCIGGINTMERYNDASEDLAGWTEQSGSLKSPDTSIWIFTRN